MYDYQNAVQKMLIEILKFFKDNPDLIKDNPVLKKHYEDLQSLYNYLVKAKKIQETDFKGITKDKNKAKAGLAKENFTLTGAVRSFASDNNNKELFEKFDSSTSDIKYSKDVDVVSYSQLVSDCLNKYKDELKPYGVAENDTKALEANTIAFNNLLALPAEMRKEVKIATEKIKETITEILTLLSESIDNDMLQYQKTQVVAYDKYFRLREIDDSQTDHLSVYGTVLYEDTKLPVLEGAVTIIRIVDGKEVIVLQVQTGNKGNYRCKSIEPGMVIVRFESPDCDRLDKKIRIYESKGVRLDVEIRKTE